MLKRLNRSKEYRAELQGKESDPRLFEEEETVELSQLPCWRHLSPEVYRVQVAGMVQEIEVDAAAERKLTGRQPLGTAGILSQSPHKKPAKVKKSPGAAACDWLGGAFCATITA